MASILNVDKIRAAGSTTDGLTIDSSGRVFKPATPAFHAYADDGNYITTSPIPVSYTHLTLPTTR